MKLKVVLARSVQEKKVIDFGFPPEGLPSLRLPLGHHRTYIGVMPRKMVQCLKNVGTTNPLVLIDEIDKVLFVCTTNFVEMIPNPLLDRMEDVAIARYITDEKMHIARDYLEKTTREACGIEPKQIALQLMGQGEMIDAIVEPIKENVDSDELGQNKIQTKNSELVEGSDPEKEGETSDKDDKVQIDLSSNESQCLEVS
ncbi:hypothetical protein JHK85_040209 [Glycine max]|nr:hypothetical protein JHK85_040209 [Glycine max]